MNYKNKIFKFSFLFFLLSSFFLFNYSAQAATCSCADKSQYIDNLCGSNNQNCALVCGGNVLSCMEDEENAADSSEKDLVPGDSKEVAPATLPNPLGVTDINALVAKIINFVLSLVGSISLLMFVYGGLTWMTSSGKSEAVKKGRDIIVWSVIGLAIVFTSYILVRFVITGLAG